MALSADQLADMQQDLKIGAAEDVFTDAELNRFFARADSDYNLAVYYAWRSLMADASKFIDYTVAHTSMKKSQIFDHIKTMVAFWQEESRTASNQVKLVGARGIPPRHKNKPAGARRKRTLEELANGLWWPP